MKAKIKKSLTAALRAWVFVSRHLFKLSKSWNAIKRQRQVDGQHCHALRITPIHSSRTGSGCRVLADMTWTSWKNPCCYWSLMMLLWSRSGQAIVNVTSVEIFYCFIKLLAAASMNWCFLSGLELMLNCLSRRAATVLRPVARGRLWWYESISKK